MPSISLRESGSGAAVEFPVWVCRVFLSPLQALMAAPSLLFLAALTAMLLRHPDVAFYEIDRVAFGFLISFVLLFLILTAQFKSFVDPLLIMLAIPMGFVGVLIILPLTGSTLNVMSLMGVLMLVGIADSNSILIVDFAHNLEKQGLSAKDAVITACRVRLRPILMTSLATIIGMIPMALKLGTGAEQYAPMAKAIIGGLTSSVVLTIFIVPAAYLLVYGKKGQENPPAAVEEAQA